MARFNCGNISSNLPRMTQLEFKGVVGRPGRTVPPPTQRDLELVSVWLDSRDQKVLDRPDEDPDPMAEMLSFAAEKLGSINPDDVLRLRGAWNEVVLAAFREAAFSCARGRTPK